MSLKEFIAGIFGIDDNSKSHYTKGYNKGYADGYAKAQKEFSENYEIIDEGEQNYTGSLTAKEEKVFKKLKSWRYLKAKRLNIKPYSIAKDTALISAVKIKPKSEEELLKIKGFGAINAEKYGKDILRIINKE
jgi:superfamily II DNA helicase RecQ